MAQAQELRDTIADIRKAGKRVFVYADAYDTAAYIAASGSKDICIMPGGEIMIPGVGMEAMFARGLLDKVGVKADYVQEDILFRRTFHSQPAGMNSPLDITLFLQQICDHGEYFELQPARARNLVTAFGRIGGHVVGLRREQLRGGVGPDRHRRRAQGHALHPLLQPLQHPADLPRGHDRASCPAREQEAGGIILEGRRLLDSIIDVRVPSMTLIIRNAFGGAYASYNSHFVGADMVFTMPMARIAVMGPGGQGVRLQGRDPRRSTRTTSKAIAQGDAEGEAERGARRGARRAHARATKRELMNPKEALSLGSVSRVVMPGTSRRVLAQNLELPDAHLHAARR